MPTNRRRRLRGGSRDSRVSPAAWAALNDEECPEDGNAFEHLDLCYPNDGGAKLEALWRAHGADVLAEWAVEHPGERPSAWWSFDAPEQPMPGESDSAALHRLGVLTAAERKRIR